MSMALRVFIGWDPRETVAYHVFAHSIIRRTTMPVAIMPVRRQMLSEYTRPRGPLESTEFSLTRFLVPYLSDYTGFSVYADCDMLCATNLAELMDFVTDASKSVYVVQHQYIPKGASKFEGHAQAPYAMKNWSSLMVFNNARCRCLTPKYINNVESGLELHQFKWCWRDDIGALPPEWNFLVGEYPKRDGIKLYHYTQGSPCFPGYEHCDYADLWHAERAHMMGESHGD